MKIQVSVILLLGILSGKASAQPVLSTSSLPTNGYQVNIYFANKPSPGPSGANIVWNFKTLPTTLGGIVKVVDPTSTPYFSMYGTANFCILNDVGGSTAYNYYLSNATGISKLAEAAGSAEAIDFSIDNRLWLKSPFNFNDTINDTWKGNDTRGLERITYDGYGTLITPFDTFTNVVRIREIRYDTTTGSAPILDTTYTWFSTNPTFQVFEIARYFALVTEPESGTTGIETINSNSNIILYPNPAHAFIQINAGNTHGTLIITDIGGKALKQLPVNGKGIQSVAISDLHPGVYFYRLIGNNALLTGYFIVN